MIELFLYPSGRLPRLKFFLLSLAVSIVTGIILAAANGREFYGTGNLSGLQAVIILLSIYPHAILGIKRLHDLDRSGWWYLLCLIPLVNIIMAIYLLFFKGSEGANRFGNNPLP